MRRTVILAGGLVAVGLVSLPSTAHAAPPPDDGWIVGVADSSSEARTIPCAGELPAGAGAALGAWQSVGATVCFPKRSTSWHVDQLGECTLRSDITTGGRLYGNCALTIDMGDYVKAWAPVGAYYEAFRIVWH